MLPIGLRCAIINPSKTRYEPVTSSERVRELTAAVAKLVAMMFYPFAVLAF